MPENPLFETAQPPASAEVQAARALFPRALFQPPGSFRFAADSLLLAAFIKPERKTLLLDLGTGCGVVALAVLCMHPSVQAHGIDKEAALLKAARQNALRLGFADRFTLAQADLSDAEAFAGALEAKASSPWEKRAGSFSTARFDLILANPPFREPGRGRLPQNPLRRAALFEEHNTLELFCACAARALAPGGSFGILYPAQRQKRLLEALSASSFTPVRMLPVQTRPQKAPLRLLVQAKRVLPEKGDLPPPAPEPPLQLYAGSGENAPLSSEALAFCPFLAS